MLIINVYRRFGKNYVPYFAMKIIIVVFGPTSGKSTLYLVRLKPKVDLTAFNTNGENMWIRVTQYFGSNEETWAARPLCYVIEYV